MGLFPSFSDTTTSLASFVPSPSSDTFLPGLPPFLLSHLKNIYWPIPLPPLPLTHFAPDLPFTPLPMKYLLWYFTKLPAFWCALITSSFFIVISGIKTGTVFCLLLFHFIFWQCGVLCSSSFWRAPALTGEREHFLSVVARDNDILQHPINGFSI